MDDIAKTIRESNAPLDLLITLRALLEKITEDHVDQIVQAGIANKGVFMQMASRCEDMAKRLREAAVAAKM